jgi:hypothetical protein
MDEGGAIMIQVPPEVLERQKEQVIEDQAGLEAAHKPFPGTSKNAFNVFPNKKAGPYDIRPFYDGDFDILESINHPLIAFIAEPEETRIKKLPPENGKTAWQIMWLFTRSIEEIEDRFDKGTLQSDFERLPRKEFGKLRREALREIYGAIYEQMSIYWDSSAAFQAKKEDEEAASSTSPPK